LNGRTRQLVVQGDEYGIREEVSESGYRTILEQVMEKVRTGEVSVEEAYRTCYFGDEA
jgi:type II secretory ATPase GspE/PulE/Tfp pilus assembly ATPase PilB-like protein